jgi:hypothetical protein
MKVKLIFHYKGSMVEMTEDPNFEGPIPRVKEEVYCDDKHRGIVFSVIHLIPQKEIVIKIRQS